VCDHFVAASSPIQLHPSRLPCLAVLPTAAEILFILIDDGGALSCEKSKSCIVHQQDLGLWLHGYSVFVSRASASHSSHTNGASHPCICTGHRPRGLESRTPSPNALRSFIFSLKHFFFVSDEASRTLGCIHDSMKRRESCSSNISTGQSHDGCR
jgi:hypothetical protein